MKSSDGKQSRDDLSLGDALEKFQRHALRQKVREPHLAVRQAQSLAVTLPVAYIALLVCGVFLMLQKPRWLQITAALGLLAGLWSLVSVFWLSSGVKAMVAGAGGSRNPVLGRVTQPLAEKTTVGPEPGLYLLVCALAVLLLIRAVSEKRQQGTR